MQAILRRIELGRCKTNIVLGSLRIERDSRQVWVFGQKVALSRREFDLLIALYEERDRGASRDELRVRAWGREAQVGPRVVDSYVRRVRDKLGPLGSYIETLHGVGYRLAGAPETFGSVRRSHPASAAAEPATLFGLASDVGPSRPPLSAGSS